MLIKLKKHILLFKIILFIFLGLFLITNHQQIMAMKNESLQNKTNTENKSPSINNKDKVVIKYKPVTKQNVGELANYFKKNPHLKDKSFQRLINHLFLINELPLKDFDLACFKPPFDKD
ncbi:putative membrane protein, SVM family protein [Candidatus Phytoplasma solani]|uniref:SVM family protein n=1 Tax=Candidatus Phytoplasma solani TaxID=69896 RepID=UPI0032DB90C3